MEFGREFDFGLDTLIFPHKCLLSEHDAKLVFTWFLSLVLVLHIRVHVAVEEARVMAVLK